MGEPPQPPRTDLQRADDEALRQHLSRELERLESAGPHDALGLERSADVAAVRAAFFACTKTYHPTRFARRDPDVVRLANEVFLRLREAHDALQAPPGRRPRASSSPRSRQSAPTSRPLRTSGPASGRAASPSAAPPLTREERAVRAGERARALRARRKRTSSAPPRAPTPADGINRVVSAAREKEKRAEEAFAAAVADLDAGRVGEARARFHELAAANPHMKSYRAHLHCARGVEHAAAGRAEEARSELERALQIAPDLRQAERALESLRRSRSRFLGRLFRR